MPVSTRWSDTSPEAMRVFVELHRGMPASDKIARVFDLTRLVLNLAAAGVRQRHPAAGEREVFLRTAALHLPRDLMIRAYGWHPDLGPFPET
jgi:hypothetical protein